MKRGYTGSRNSDYYMKRIRPRDSKGCNSITSFFKVSNVEKTSDEPIKVSEEICDMADISQKCSSEADVANSCIKSSVERMPDTHCEELKNDNEEQHVDQALPTQECSSHVENLACENVTEIVTEKRQHSVNIGKYEKLYDWLYYSVSADGFLCKVCSVFQQKGPWIDQGIILGDHPTRCIVKHQSSVKHKQAVATSKNVSKRSVIDSFSTVSELAVEKTKESNKILLIKYIKVLYFMIKKQWAVSENFASLVQFIGEDLGDKDIESHLSTCGKNATYLSNISVQNITEAISIYLEEKTITALQLTECFALLADESTDEAQREQLGLMARYKVNGVPGLKEDYLGIINLASANAESITSEIEKFMIAKAIKITDCLFVALDGANVMSGDITGVQRRIRYLSPHSLYINCRNHRLALVFAHLVKRYGLLQAVDSVLISLWKLFHYSPKKQQVFKDIQKDVYGIRILKTLKVSITRWLSHGLACARVTSRFQHIVETLDALFNETKEPELKGLREQLLNTDVLLCILFLADFLKIVNKLNLWLQSPGIMFSSVSEKVLNVCKEVDKLICNLHDGDNFKKFEELLPFSQERMEFSMKRRGNKKYKVNVCDIVEDFRENFVKSFVIDFQKEITAAFKINNEALSAFDMFNTLDIDLKTQNNQDENCLSVLLSFYGEEQQNEFQGTVKTSSPIINSIEAVKEKNGFEKEMSLAKVTFDMEKAARARTLLKEDKKEEAKNMLERKITAIEALEIIERDSINWTQFPNLLKLLSLSTIIPTSTASVERLFSRMNLVCTELRTKLKQETLDRHLRIILNGPDKLSNDECMSIINIFKSSGNRRILL